jgi:putative cell wall-binding protein
VNTAYSQALAATGTTPITWSVPTGALPAGLALNTTTGAITGTPTTATTATFTVKAQNVAGSVTKSLSITVAAVVEQPPVRLDGNKGAAGNRFDTMAAIVQEAFADGSADTVILARSNEFPDALAASALAGLVNAPILLTETSTLTATTKSEIERLGASKVIIVGGTSAVSTAVENTLKAMSGITVLRYAGDSREATAIDVFNKGKALVTGGWSDTAIIARKDNFADALSVSPFAYATKSPIFLATPATGLDAATVAAIKSGGFTNIVIVGGTAAVPDSVKTQLGTAFTYTRLGEANRYQTSAKIATWSVTNSGGALGYNNLAVATGFNFPDALAGSALCGQKGTVLLLVHEQESDGTYGITNVIAAQKDAISQVYVLGGTAAVSDKLKTLISNAHK